MVKKGWTRKRPVVRSVDAKQNRNIAKLKKEVKLLKKPVEKKYFDNVYNNAAYYNTATGFSDSVVGLLINDVIAWDTDDPNANAYRNIQREGNDIMMTSLRIRGTISLPTRLPGGGVGDTINSTRVRMILVQSPSSNNMLLANFLQDPVTGSLAINSPLKIDPQFRYKILLDKTIPLTNMFQTLGDSVSDEGYRKTININLKFKKGLLAHWKATATTSPAGLEPDQNSLVLWLISESEVTATGGAPAANQLPQFVGTSRLRFIDN